MVCQMATTALLFVHFSDSPLLGGIAVVVRGLVPFGGFGVNRRQMGKTVAGLRLWRVWLVGGGGCVGRSPRL